MDKNKVVVVGEKVYILLSVDFSNKYYVMRFPDKSVLADLASGDVLTAIMSGNILYTGSEYPEALEQFGINVCEALNDYCSYSDEGKSLNSSKSIDLGFLN